MAAPKPGQWSTGLCDCCSDPGGCGRCCYGFWCPCCLVGDNFQRLPGHVMCGSSWCGACLTWYVMASFLAAPCIPTMMSRSYLRRKYNIPGDDCSDFCVTWCCSPCYLCQEAREMDIREGVGRPVTEMHHVPAAAYPAPPVGMYPGQPGVQMHTVPGVPHGYQPPPPPPYAGQQQMYGHAQQGYYPPQQQY